MKNLLISTKNIVILVIKVLKKLQNLILTFCAYKLWIIQKKLMLMEKLYNMDAFIKNITSITN